MKKFVILAVAAGFVSATMMPTEAMARRGGSLKSAAAPKHHEFAGAFKPAKPSGKTRVRVKRRLIKVHGVVTGSTLK
jgi:hypothetical protein